MFVKAFISKPGGHNFKYYTVDFSRKQHRRSSIMEIRN
jgi:hypothetical protein